MTAEAAIAGSEKVIARFEGQQVQCKEFEEKMDKLDLEEPVRFVSPPSLLSPLVFLSFFLFFLSLFFYFLSLFVPFSFSS